MQRGSREFPSDIFRLRRVELNRAVKWMIAWPDYWFSNTPKILRSEVSAGRVRNFLYEYCNVQLKDRPTSARVCHNIPC